MRSSRSPARPVHIIVNPAAGSGQAQKFVDDHVLPLLGHFNLPVEVHETSGVRDTGRIGRGILSKSSETKVTVVIAGGDGTAHEMIEGVLEGVREGSMLGRWELAILPLGTANALFASLFPPPERPISVIPDDVQRFLDSRSTPEDTIHKLSSLLTCLTSTNSPRRLPITLTTLISPDATSKPTPTPIPSHIVLSTSLHAALLSTSETLRATHPGLERFKLAAEANLGVLFRASVKLLPPRGGTVKQYDPRAQNWTSPYTASSSNGELKLEGPFTYLLSSTTTPRLEPTFVISPLLAKIPPSETDAPSMDIIILRPLRDPRVRAKETEAAQSEASKERAKEVLGWAYQEGGHVDLTYPKQGDGTAELRGDGDVVVESFRCAGFEWTPTDRSHEPSHIVCADGSLHHIAKGGMAQVEIMDAASEPSDEGFYVWG